MPSEWSTENDREMAKEAPTIPRDSWLEAKDSEPSSWLLKLISVSLTFRALALRHSVTIMTTPLASKIHVGVCTFSAKSPM